MCQIQLWIRCRTLCHHLLTLSFCRFCCDTYNYNRKILWLRLTKQASPAKTYRWCLMQGSGSPVSDRSFTNDINSEFLLYSHHHPILQSENLGTGKEIIMHGAF